MTGVRDYQRAKVYAAERILQRAYERGKRIEMSAAVLQLEPEARFAGIADIQRYVDQVLALPAVVERFGAQRPVAVRERKSDNLAHFDRSSRTIAVHSSGTRWSLRELLVLHELAHALSPLGGHGPAFTSTLVDLMAAVMGPQVSLALRLLYGENGVDL